MWLLIKLNIIFVLAIQTKYQIKTNYGRVTRETA
jgi:hypothetical protein